MIPTASHFPITKTIIITPDHSEKGRTHDHDHNSNKHHRQGIATHLVHHTLHAAHHLGFNNLVAILLDCNTPSIALLESFGFEPWGTLPMVAELQGQHFSHLYYGLKL